MNFFRLKYLFPYSLLLALSACDLEQEIDIDLPVYTRQRVLECYVEKGQPFRLLLTNSSSFFDPIPSDDLIPFLESLLEKGADVRIRFDGREALLQEGISFDPVYRKFFNYSSTTLVPDDFDGLYELEIILQDGRTITSATRILPVVPIDSIAVEFDDKDSLARTLIYVNDDPSERNYYRRMLHLGSVADSFPSQDFATDDQFLQNSRLVFGSAYRSSPGDTVYNTIFHIDKAYFDYFISVRNALSSGGNPFAQPGIIRSNLSGSADAIGIFTGLSYDRQMTVITK